MTRTLLADQKRRPGGEAIPRAGRRAARACKVASQFGLASTPHTVGNERALVLSYSPSDLNDELFVRVVAPRPVDKHNADSMPLKFFEDDHLVHVVACETIWRRDQHHVEGRPCSLVTQGVQARSLELGPRMA